MGLIYHRLGVHLESPKERIGSTFKQYKTLSIPIAFSELILTAISFYFILINAYI